MNAARRSTSSRVAGRISIGAPNASRRRSPGRFTIGTTWPTHTENRTGRTGAALHFAALRRPLLTVVLIVAGVVGALAITHDAHPRSSPSQDIHKLKHVVVIMQENRSFDSYFGTYKGAEGIPQTKLCLRARPAPGRLREAVPQRASIATSAALTLKKRPVLADIDNGADGRLVRLRAVSARLRGCTDPDRSQSACTAAAAAR